MLIDLSIRDVVLIDRLSLSFDGGLGVLTGETGAGKSILLDALGLAIGARADAGLVRKDCQEASVSAGFEVADGHPALDILREHELSDVAERAAEEGLILRRKLTAAGRSRAFVNDEPVSVALLRQLGECLIEIHGQFETQGLLNPQSHLRLLDGFAGLEERRTQCANAWQQWQQRLDDRKALAAGIAQAQAEEDFLRTALDDLQSLAPEIGEETALDERRTFLLNRGKLAVGINSVAESVSGDSGAEVRIGQAQRALERLGDHGGIFDPLVDALNRAAAETAEAAAQVNALTSSMDAGEDDLETVEERLFSLRDMARKHRSTPDELPALMADFAQRLTSIEDSGSDLAKLDQQIAEARQSYVQLADTLHESRLRAAENLDRQMAAELPPLKLENARFATRLEQLGEADWGPSGRNRAVFCVSTNPGTEPEPLARIASGGELARITLAIKVTLARAAEAESGNAAMGPTLIFDEVDSGISGSVADAVGERLAEIGSQVQVLVVTHS
ncbi:MAG: DNA repair protein RecN, partial [Pseudomonadota bacterium]